MELHNLTPGNAERKTRKRVGRGPGSGLGKTSGKGHKGQQARSGYSRRFGFEGGQMPMHRRLPKRGFRHGDRWPQAIINVDVLCERFEDGATVSSADIVAAGLVHSKKGGVKVLGRGDATKKLTLQVQAISPSAQTKIEAAGGKVELVATAPASSDEVQE